jgi:hypothetical protein
MFVSNALVLLWLLVSATKGHPMIRSKGNFLLVACALVVAIAPESIGIQPREVASRHRDRRRKYDNDIVNDLGPYYLRRAYRMEPASFWKLCRLLKPFVVKSASNEKK